MCMLMCIHMLTKRTNILFDDLLWNQMTQLAKKRKTSVGELVRQAVSEKYLNDDKTERIKKACEAIEKTRKLFKGKIDYKALINYGRKY